MRIKLLEKMMLSKMNVLEVLAQDGQNQYNLDIAIDYRGDCLYNLKQLGIY